MADFEKRKKELAKVLKEFTDAKHQKMVKDTFGKVKGCHERLKILIKTLDGASVAVNRKNWDEAEEIYKKIYFNTGNLRIKRAYSKGEFVSFLDKHNNQFKFAAEKLRRAKNLLDKLVKPCERTIKIYDNIRKIAHVVAHSEIRRQQMNALESTDDYRKYYRNIASDFSKLSSVLKGISGKMPPGAREYCEFIFDVAKKTEAAAKIVDNHTKKIIDLTKEMDGLLKK